MSASTIAATSRGTPRERSESSTGTLRGISRKSSLELANTHEDDKVIFFRRFETHVADIYRKGCEIIEKSNVVDRKKYISQNFCSERKIRKSALPISTINKIILQNHQIFKKEIPNDFDERSAIPDSELKNLETLFTTGPLKHWKRYEKHFSHLTLSDSAASPPTAESNFRDKREAALKKLKKLKYQVFPKHQKKPDKDDEINFAKTLTEVRKATFDLYKNEPQIGKEALSLLCDLLDCDHIHEDSALYVVELQGLLRKEIQRENAEKLNLPLQRLLMRAYACCFDCILLHYAAKNLNAISEETRREFWKTVSSELIKLNTHDDIQIKDYAAYSLQAVQHLETDMGTFKKIATSIIDVIRALIKVGGIYGDASQAPELIDGAVADIKNAFRYIGYTREWFSEVLLLKKACKYSLDNPKAFRRIADNIKGKLNQGCEDNYLYGLINTLTAVVTNSKNVEVQEEAFKILISIDNPKCTSRLIIALSQLINVEGKVGNTAKLIIQLQKHCGKLHERDIESIDDSTQRFERQQSSTALLEIQKPAMLHMKEAYFLSVIKYQLRRLSLISDNQDFGGHTLATMLISSEENILPSLLECLKKYSNELMQPNIFGKSPLHVAAEKGKAKSIEYFFKIVGSNLNLKEYETGNTPLHLAASGGHEEAVRTLLKLGADPFEVNYEKSTPLHQAVESGHVGIAKLLLERINEKVHQINSLGCSGLNTSINLDNVEMFKLLYAAKVKPAEQSSSMTMIRIVARKQAQNILTYLLLLPNTKLTRAEKVDVIQMIEKVKLSPANFRSLKDSGFLAALNESDKLKALAPSQSIDFSGARKSALQRAPSLIDLKDDRHGNNPLIKFAQSTDSFKDLQKLLEISKYLNQPNIDDLSALHTSVICEKCETARALLAQENCDPSIGDIRKFTPIHMAALLQRKEIVKLILANSKGKSTVTLKNDYGETALHLSCGLIVKRAPDSIGSVLPSCNFPKEDCVDLIELLLEAGSDPYHKDISGNTILHRAFAYSGTVTVQFLIKRYPELFWIPNLQGKLPIEYGLHFSRLENVQEYFKSLTIDQLVDRNNELIDKTNRKITLSYLLIKAKLPELFEKLVDKKPEVATYVDGTSRELTPLHYAAMEGLTEIFEIYLRRNIPITSTDKYGNTVAHYMVNMSQSSRAKCLENHQSLWSIPNQDRQLPLHIAATKGDVDFTRFIIKTKVKDLPDGHGDTAFHLACKFGRRECITELCALHIEEEIDPKNDDGNTPFGFICMSGVNGLDIEIFIKKSDLEWPNNYGSTPVILASANGSIDTLNKILEENVNFHHVDHQGENALHKACFKGNYEVVKALKTFEDARIVPVKLTQIKDTHGEIPIMEIVKKPKKNSVQSRESDCKIFKELKDDSKLDEVNTKGENILHLACLNGHDHMFKPIVEENKSLLTKQDKDGNTPFHKACIGNHDEFIEKFDKIDKDFRGKKNNNKQTPLLLAAMLGNVEFARKVIRKDEASEKDIEERTLFHLLLSRPVLLKKHIDFFEEMLKEYPHLIFEKDKYNRTILHIIAEYNHPESLVEMIYCSLTGNPARVLEFINAKNTSGLTAVDVAQEKRHSTLERKLRNPRIDSLGPPNVKNKRNSGSNNNK